MRFPPIDHLRKAEARLTRAESFNHETLTMTKRELADWKEKHSIDDREYAIEKRLYFKEMELVLRDYRRMLNDMGFES